MNKIERVFFSDQDTRRVFLLSSAVFLVLALAGCAGLSVAQTETIIGLRLRSGSQGMPPDASFGLIRSHTVIVASNHTAGVVTTTDAEHSGWNRAKVHTAVIFGTNAAPATPANMFDAWPQPGATNTP